MKKLAIKSLFIPLIVLLLSFSTNINAQIGVSTFNVCITASNYCLSPQKFVIKNSIGPIPPGSGATIYEGRISGASYPPYGGPLIIACMTVGWFDLPFMQNVCKMYVETQKGKSLTFDITYGTEDVEIVFDGGGSISAIRKN